MNPPAGVVQPTAVALVPVAGSSHIGLLLVERGEEPDRARLPSISVDGSDASWQDAVVRAVSEQAGLSVTFQAHVTTVSTADELLIFAQTHPVDAAQIQRACKRGVRVMTPDEPGAPLAVEAHARVVAQWFADHEASRASAAAADRRCAVTGRRAADADALVRIDAVAAVRCVHQLVAEGARFSEDPYARTLLERVLRALISDQRARWGERGSDLLLTFLWGARRDQLPVDDMLAFAAEWACAQATADPSACFACSEIDRARSWMDSVALAHGLGRVMAPFHVAEPVALVRPMLGFGRFGRLDSKLRGDTETVLTRLDEQQWERAYVALGALKPAALTPTGLNPEQLLDGFADVLARPERLLAAR